ncbi:MAG: hypothetical protein ACTSXG_00645 [Alphaproteobacteria bacterium]
MDYINKLKNLLLELDELFKNASNIEQFQAAYKIKELQSKILMFFLKDTKRQFSPASLNDDQLEEMIRELEISSEL